MYKLLVNTNPEDPEWGEWVSADVGDATIALTYEANNLAELKSREVNRSNRIKLPRTPVNDRLFGMPTEPLSVTVERTFSHIYTHYANSIINPNSDCRIAPLVFNSTNP